MAKNLRQVYQVTRKQYDTLVKEGSIQSGSDLYIYDDNYLYEIQDQDKLLWRNCYPTTIVGAKTFYFNDGVDITMYKYLVFIFGATEGQNDGAHMAKFLNPFWSLADSSFSDRKTHFYLSFVNDSGTIFCREITTLAQNYFTVARSFYATSSASSSTASDAYCIPLEVWGTNRL